MPTINNFYPNWDFWFENKPSGNPESRQKITMVLEKGSQFFCRKLTQICSDDHNTGPSV
jgi:hypothetical protein